MCGVGFNSSIKALLQKGVGNINNVRISFFSSHSLCLKNLYFRVNVYILEFYSFRAEEVGENPETMDVDFNLYDRNELG